MVRISIIIPTFNSAKTLSIALESILKQSFSDYEILIIDGLSTDNTIAIAENYQDTRIKLFSEKDKGIYDAMNKGIEYSKGEWLYFLGSDDKLYHSDILKDVFNEVEKNKCDVIYGDVYSTRFNGRHSGEYNYKKIFDQNICHQAIFFKKKIFKKTGLFNLRYRSHADWDHNMHWLLDPTISKSYYDCIIADYADGGFSSLNGDPLFDNEKTIKYLIYGKAELPFDLRVRLIKQELRKNINSRDLQLFLKLGFNTPKILLNI